MSDHPELARVRRAALSAAVARDELHAALRAAHAAGLSVRQLGPAAMVSRETVRRIVRAG